MRDLYLALQSSMEQADALQAAVGALDDADIAAVDGYLKAPAGASTATTPVSTGNGQPVKARPAAAR